METKSWMDRLRLLREERGIKRSDLAGVSGISEKSLYSYEAGWRRPSRQTLDRILDVLGVTIREADLIRHEMGFSTVAPPPGLYRRLIDHQQYLDEVPWPLTIQNASLEILDVNHAQRRLIEWVDRYRGERVQTAVPKAGPSRAIFASEFDRRLPYIVNLEEVLAHMVAFWKSVHGSRSDQMPLWMDECLDSIAQIDRTRRRSGSLLATFLHIWEQTPPRAPRVKHYHPVIIASPDVGQMEFLNQMTLVDEHERLYVSDMIPTNGYTWDCLNAIIEGYIPSSAI